MFEVDILPSAVDDLRMLRKYDRQKVVTVVREQLAIEPDVETTNKKRLRPNDLSEWELRKDNLRIFYDVDRESMVVLIRAVGYKQGNRLFIGGEEYKL